MTMKLHEFLAEYRIDMPARARLTCDLALGEDGESALRTLARIGFERLLLLRPLANQLGNVFFIDPYQGKVGTLDVALRQPPLFEDMLQRTGTDGIEAGLEVLSKLPLKYQAVQSLEELEASGAGANWSLVVGLAKVAEGEPGLDVRLDGKLFTLPKRLSDVQTEFVADAITSLANCIVLDASKEAFVQLACPDANADSWHREFRAYISSDNPVRKQLELACVLNLTVDFVRVRRVRSLSHAQICAYVESVEVDVARVRNAIDAHLAGRTEPDS